MGDGNGPFFDLTSGIGRIKGRSLGVAFNDYDGDGARIFLVRMTHAPILSSQQMGMTPLRNGCSMPASHSLTMKALTPVLGVDFRDWDTDDRPDLHVTNLSKSYM